MARGWESKSVEDQIQERQAASASPKPKATPEERQRQARKDGLLLVRTRTLTALQMACDARHRAHLERVLSDLDAQLATLEAQPEDLGQS